jgi:hypothetical protein
MRLISSASRWDVGGRAVLLVAAIVAIVAIAGLAD